MTQEEKRDKRYNELTQGRLYPLLVKMAVPSMIGMMVSTVYSMTDTYFVGKLNDVDATAAVGIVYTFISLIQALGFWFGYGAGNYISRMLGKNLNLDFGLGFWAGYETYSVYACETCGRIRERGSKYFLRPDQLILALTLVF